MTLSDEERQFISFHLRCRLDDYAKKIKLNEKRGNDSTAARAQHAKLERLTCKLNPSSLCGPLDLMDGTIIHPEDIS